MGFDSWQGQNLPFLQNIQTSSGVHLSFGSVDTGDYFHRGKWLEHEADCLPPSGMMVKNE